MKELMENWRSFIDEVAAKKPLLNEQLRPRRWRSRQPAEEFEQYGFPYDPEELMAVIPPDGNYREQFQDHADAPKREEYRRGRRGNMLYLWDLDGFISDALSSARTSATQRPDAPTPEDFGDHGQYLRALDRYVFEDPQLSQLLSSQEQTVEQEADRQTRRDRRISRIRDRRHERSLQEAGISPEEYYAYWSPLHDQEPAGSRAMISRSLPYPSNFREILDETEAGMSDQQLAMRYADDNPSWAGRSSPTPAQPDPPPPSGRLLPQEDTEGMPEAEGPFYDRPGPPELRRYPGDPLDIDADDDYYSIDPADLTVPPLTAPLGHPAPPPPPAEPLSRSQRRTNRIKDRQHHRALAAANITPDDYYAYWSPEHDQDPLGSRAMQSRNLPYPSNIYDILGEHETDMSEDELAIRYDPDNPTWAGRQANTPVEPPYDPWAPIESETPVGSTATEVAGTEWVGAPSNTPGALPPDQTGARMGWDTVPPRLRPGGEWGPEHFATISDYLDVLQLFGVYYEEDFRSRTATEEDGSVWRHSPIARPAAKSIESFYPSGGIDEEFLIANYNLFGGGPHGVAQGAPDEEIPPWYDRDQEFDHQYSIDPGSLYVSDWESERFRSLTSTTRDGDHIPGRIEAAYGTDWQYDPDRPFDTGPWRWEPDPTSDEPRAGQWVPRGFYGNEFEYDRSTDIFERTAGTAAAPGLIEDQLMTHSPPPPFRGEDPYYDWREDLEPHEHVPSHLQPTQVPRSAERLPSDLDDPQTPTAPDAGLPALHYITPEEERQARAQERDIRQAKRRQPRLRRRAERIGSRAQRAQDALEQNTTTLYGQELDDLRITPVPNLDPADYADPDPAEGTEWHPSNFETPDDYYDAIDQGYIDGRLPVELRDRVSPSVLRPGDPSAELNELKNFLNKWESFSNRSIIQEKISPKDVDTSSFVINKELEPNIWTNEQQLHPRVRRKLLNIVERFWRSLDFLDLRINDIIFTGSLANYNWSKYSDVDLHILVDLSLLPGEIDVAESLMTAKRINWNKKHNIEIYGYEVEIYIHDYKQPAPTAAGMYSVLKDQWKSRPYKEDLTIDDDNIKFKAAHLMSEIDKIEKSYEDGEYKQVHSDTERLKEKISKFRKCGLEQDGEYSSENLAFKALRRNGYLQKLSKLRTDSYDKMMSLW